MNEQRINTKSTAESDEYDSGEPLNDSKRPLAKKPAAIMGTVLFMHSPEKPYSG